MVLERTHKPPNGMKTTRLQNGKHAFYRNFASDHCKAGLHLRGCAAWHTEARHAAAQAGMWVANWVAHFWELAR